MPWLILISSQCVSMRLISHIGLLYSSFELTNKVILFHLQYSKCEEPCKTCILHYQVSCLKIRRCSKQNISSVDGPLRVFSNL